MGAFITASFLKNLVPLFRKRTKIQPGEIATPDFTNQKKIREYISDMHGNKQELKEFQAKLRIMRKHLVKRYYRISEDLDYIKYYEYKKASGSFEPNYCVVKWHKDYTRHVVFWGAIHRKYDRIKSEHSRCEPGQGFYMYDERTKFLIKWINSIIDIDLLVKIESCLLAGLEPV